MGGNSRWKCEVPRLNGSLLLKLCYLLKDSAAPVVFLYGNALLKGNRKKKDGTLVQRTEELPCSAHEQESEKSRAQFPFFPFFFQSPEDSPGQHTALWLLRTFNILPLSMLNIGKNSWCGQYVVRRKVKHFCREHKRLQIKNTTRTDFWPRLPVSRCTAALSPKWLATAIVPYKQKKWGQM